MIKRLARFFQNHRRYPWVRRADRALLEIHRAYENLDYDSRTNGEFVALLNLARVTEFRTLFDVGANRGEWCDLANRIFDEADIHAFEIVPETFSHLNARFGDTSRVVLNNLGLSDTTGMTDVYYTPGRDAISTCIPEFLESFHNSRAEVRSARISTGDEYCREHGIDRIGFLKIDVEGLEPRVLHGFRGMLGRGAIDVVQFEYGYIAIHTRFLLRDFYELFASHNMLVGKIYPDHVDFRRYSYAHEDFIGPNFLAVPAVREDLLRALRAAH